MMSKLQRYKSLLASLEEYADILDNDRDVDVRAAINNTLKVLKVSEDFGIDFGHVYHYAYRNFTVNEFSRVLKWSEESSIGIPDDGRQPEAGEYLYVICFPTGPYIFGKHYPEELFREFFDVLVSYKPKYLDTPNTSLYFDKSNAKFIHEDFDRILKEYQNRVKDDYKRIRRQQLEDEIRKLEMT